MKKAFIIICAVMFFLFTGNAGAQNAGEGLPPMPPPPMGDPLTDAAKTPIIKLVSPGLFEIGGVNLDKKNGKIEFKAVINMDKGLLEYLLVGQSGKLHESLLRTDVEPFNLQVALLMMGLEGSMNPLMEQGQEATPGGDPVQIMVKWDNKDKTEAIPVENWICIKEKEEVKKRVMDWVFTGSIINNGIFMAQAEKSIIALYHDPVAMFDNKSSEGASDEMWFVDEKTVPKNGTEVTVVINALEKR